MSDPINEIRPGQAMSDTQRKALAESNEKATNEAHKLAAERRAQDDLTQPPTILSVAESIKEKLRTLPPEESVTSQE